MHAGLVGGFCLSFACADLDGLVMQGTGCTAYVQVRHSERGTCSVTQASASMPLQRV
jgi:hypothetical protein